MIIEHIPLRQHPRGRFNVYNMLRLAINGLVQQGVEVKTCYACTNISPNSTALLTWGLRRARGFRKMKKPLLILEHGFIGDREQNISISLNDINGRGLFPHPTLPNRLPKDALAPWRTGGQVVLIAGQVRGDQALRGVDLYNSWYRIMAAQCARYGLPVVFRQHPVEVKRVGVKHVRGATTSTKSLQEDLARAALVVTYNSNLGVDAMLAGVPTYVEDRGGMAYPVALHTLPPNLNIKEPFKRYTWANRVASCQFTRGELRAGVWVPAVKEYFGSSLQ